MTNLQKFFFIPAGKKGMTPQQYAEWLRAKVNYQTLNRPNDAYANRVKKLLEGADDISAIKILQKESCVQNKPLGELLDQPLLSEIENFK